MKNFAPLLIVVLLFAIIYLSLSLCLLIAFASSSVSMSDFWSLIVSVTRLANYENILDFWWMKWMDVLLILWWDYDLPPYDEPCDSEARWCPKNRTGWHAYLDSMNDPWIKGLVDCKPKGIKSALLTFAISPTLWFVLSIGLSVLLLSKWIGMIGMGTQGSKSPSRPESLQLLPNGLHLV